MKNPAVFAMWMCFGAVLTPLRYLDFGATFTFPRFGGKSDTRDLRQLAAFVAFRI